MDEQTQKWYGLMNVALEHQQAIGAALEGLAQERVKLAQERAALAQATAGMVGAAGEVRSAAVQSVPAMQRAVGEAVGASVRQSLAGASEAATQALAEAAKPVIGSLSSVVQAAHDAEGSMRRAGAWFAWKWVALAAGGLVGVCLVAYAALGWQLLRIQSLGDEKAALAADVVQLQANVAAMEKRGGRIVLSTCGGRLCIEASSNQGKGAEKWKGHWSSKENGVTFVIPRGY
jgi:hypothetical protein